MHFSRFSEYRNISWFLPAVARLLYDEAAMFWEKTKTPFIVLINIRVKGKTDEIELYRVRKL
jgi:hypothetical protein